MSHRVNVAMYRTAVLALAVFSLIPTAFDVIGLFPQQTTFGVVVPPTLRLESIDDRVEKMGIRLGDRVDIGAMPFADRRVLFTPVQARLGTHVALPIVRNGARQWFDLVAMTYGDVSFLRYYSWFTLFAALICVAVGAIFVLLRPSVMTWAFYVYALGMHVLFDAGYIWGPLPVALVSWLGFDSLHAIGHGAFIAFAARFPSGRADRGWKLFDGIAIAVCLVELPVTLMVEAPFYSGVPSPNVYPLDEKLFWFVYVVAAIALCLKMFTLRGRQRVATGWVLLGSAGAFAGEAIYRYPVVGPMWIRFVLYSACYAILPISVLVAVLSVRAFSLGFFANRTLVYAFFAAAIASVFVALDWFLSSAVAFSPSGLAAGLAASLAMGMLLQAQHRRVVRIIDRIFLPQRYAAGVALDRLRDDVRNGLRPPAETIADKVTEALGLASLAVFARTSDGGFVRQVSCGWSDDSFWHLLPEDRLCRTLVAATTTVRLSERDTAGVALPAARPTLAISVRRRGRIERVILVGERRNGSVLDRDEVRGLSAVLAEVAA